MPPNMEAHTIRQHFESLLDNARSHIERSQRIETSDLDDQFIRICVSGFLVHATADRWGQDTYRFVCDARSGALSDSMLQGHFGDDWRPVGLFHCLFTGYNLGLYASNGWELAVFAFRDSRLAEIVAAFRADVT